MLEGLFSFRSPFGGAGSLPLPASPIQRSFVAGASTAAGVEFGSRRLRPTVEFRYPRWIDPAVLADESNAAVANPLPVIIRSNQNQAQFLLGLMF